MSEHLRELSAKVALEVDTGGLEALHHKIEGIHSSLELLAGVEILRGLFELGERFSHFGEDIEGAAASAGITAEAFQQLAFAASQSGVGQEQLSGALGRLGRMLGQAREGSEGAIESFAKIGITDDQIAGFHNSSDALKAVADQISGIQDPIAKTRVAMELFGRSGTKLIKLLGKGGANITEEMARAEGMGAVVSDDGIESLAKLEDALTAFGQIIKATMATVATYVSPIVQDLVKLFGAFIQKNRDLVGTNVKTWFGYLGYALGFIVELSLRTAQGLINIAKAFPKVSWGVTDIVSALAGANVVFWGAEKAFKAIKTVLDGLTGLFGNTLGFFKDAFHYGGKFGRMLGRIPEILGEIVFGMGSLVGKVFPALGAAIESLGVTIAGTPLLGVAAALSAMVVASHDLWVLWNGGNFKDTWIGQGIQAIIDASKLLGLLAGTASAAELPSVEHTEWQAPSTLMNPMPVAQAQAAVAKMQAPMPPGPMGSVIGADGVPSLLSPSSSGAVTIQNTYNITSPPGADASRLAQMIKEITTRDQASMLRQAKDILSKPRVM